MLSSFRTAADNMTRRYKRKHLLRTARFLATHPLTRNRLFTAMLRFVRWQVQSRLANEVIYDWIGGARLAVRRGMTGATGNVYAGLHEFGDMALLLHLLRPGDLFVDVGANVGSYTVLAGKVCGADVIAVEPDPHTMSALNKNIALNEIEASTHVEGVALGATTGSVRFTAGLDTKNKVMASTSAVAEDWREVPLMRLDDVVGDRTPILMKLDVEGYEAEVLKGAARTLAAPALLAIESESEDREVLSILARAGFLRTYYDPFTRSFSSDANSLAVNALFVRDVAVCHERCATARRHSILGCEI